MTRSRFLLIALAASLAGCSNASLGVGPVDAPKAREALRTALDGWKGGHAPDSFASASPAMTVQDMDWSSGAKLVGYKAAEGKEVGNSLHVPVTLTLRPKQGREVKKDVTYIVGTSPIVTIFRGLH